MLYPISMGGTPQEPPDGMAARGWLNYLVGDDGSIAFTSTMLCSSMMGND